MGLTKRVAVPIPDRKKLGPTPAALEQKRADLRFTAPETLTRRNESERTEAL